MSQTSRFISATFASFLLTGSLSCVSPQAHANYKAKALEATDAIQKAYYDEPKGIYRPQIPVDPKGLQYEVMWGNGIQFSTIVAAARYEPQRYRPVMYAYLKGMERYWDKDAPIPGYDAYFASKDNDDKYYDDNAWLVLGFTEAYRDTKDPVFLKWARQTQDFVLSAYDEKLGGGLYWYQNKKTSKNTCTNAPAIVGAVALYEITKQQSDLDWAKKLYDWTCKNLQDKDGLFWDNINLEGKVEETKWTYNTALMIRANLDLWRVTKESRYLNEARRVSDAALVRWVDRQSGAFKDSARFNHLLAEALVEAHDATKDTRYLNAVRRHADFGYRYVRDVRNGLYFNKWNAVNRPDSETKTLIEGASAARLFWVLAPYQDVEELRANAEKAEKGGDRVSASSLYQQAFDSTAGAAATMPPVTRP